MENRLNKTDRNSHLEDTIGWILLLLFLGPIQTEAQTAKCLLKK